MSVRLAALWIPWVGLGLLSLPACSPKEAAPAPTAPELRDVVKQRLAALDAEVGPPEALPELDESWREEVDGLVTMLASAKGELRTIPLASIREDIGPRAIPRLGEALANPEGPAQERIAAAELLASLDHPQAAELLLVRAERAPEPWIRSWCAWYLGEMSQDQVLPRLILRLRYEKDPDTFLWLGRAMLSFNNYAGLSALEDLARQGGDENRRRIATEQLELAAERAGVSRAQLRSLWSSQDAGQLPQPEPSPRLRREVWRLVGELSEEHFQLRGVDDSRHILSNMGPWVAREIAPALGDRDAHVRLHTAQVLERMGPRAAETGPALLAALADPRLAPAAAEALGRVGYPPAVPVLAARSAPGNAHELRVAAVRALGRTGLAEGLPALWSAYRAEDSPLDLRQAAATALVLLDEGDQVIGWLTERLVDPAADAEAAELAIETWIARGEQSGRAGFPTLLRSWRLLAGPPGVIPSLDQVAERLEARARLLGESSPLSSPPSAGESDDG